MGQELVQLRRQLVADYGRVRVALETEPTLSADLDRITQAVRLHAAFRSRNAINQADWPVIRVRDHPQDYRRAIAPLRRRHSLFGSGSKESSVSGSERLSATSD